MKQYLLSIIVCTHNPTVTFLRCIESLDILNDIDSIEIIVVDNASNKRTREMINKEICTRPYIQLISEPTIGLSFARNTGIRCAHAPIIAFLDDDAEMAPEWPKVILDLFNSYPKAGAIGGAISLEYLTPPPAWLGQAHEPYLGLFNVSDDVCTLTYPNYPRGGNMALRRAALGTDIQFQQEFGKVGSSLMCFEEIDLCYRLEKNGWECLFAPAAKVIHLIEPFRFHRLWFKRRAFQQGKAERIFERLQNLPTNVQFSDLFKKFWQQNALEAALKIGHMRGAFSPLSTKKKSHILHFSFPTLKRIWIFFGEPFPNFARFIRHRIVGYFQRISKNEKMGVAIVVACHNHGERLRQTIDSIVCQTYPASEIIIIGTAADCEVVNVIKKYKENIIFRTHAEWNSIDKIHHMGLDSTNASYLIFLNTGDILHPNYLECGVTMLKKNPQAGFVYSNYQDYQSSKIYHHLPMSVSVKEGEILDSIHYSAMIRREALYAIYQPSEALDSVSSKKYLIEMLSRGWIGIKSAGPSFTISKIGIEKKLQISEKYEQLTGVSNEDITLCLSLSGRSWAWTLMKDFLNAQIFPHKQIHFIILDTSQDEVFGNMIQEWIKLSDYQKITYRRLEVGLKGIADLPRNEVAKEIGVACSLIYNTFSKMVDTSLAIILEDDVIPPLDAFPQLLQCLEPDVMSVSALYWHRNLNKPVCWDWNNEESFPIFPTPKRGVHSIGGTGFGCLLLRGDIFRNTYFQSNEPFPNYDHNFFAELTLNGKLRALLNWDCVCRHYQSPDIWY